MGEFVKGSRLKKLRMRVEPDSQFIPGAKKLKIRGKELDELPAELFVMTELQVLDLSPERESCIYYHLTEIPPAISRLVNLRILMLDTNSISILPPAITLLKHLQKISISNNALTSLPAGFENLQSLESLHAANNEFQVFPQSLCKLERLHFLDFSDNKLTAIPETIRDCRNLETFLLFMNELTSLPDGICELVELRSLWVGNNNITKLPKRFSQLVHLDWGSRYMSSCVVDGNPLKHPPVYVCKQGVAGIANYFQVTDPDKARPKVHPTPTPSKSPEHKMAAGVKVEE